MTKGKFITLEGAEGSGKSTQSALILDYFKSKKMSAMLLREPGGVKIAEHIRAILLDVKNIKMSDTCETLLYMAARAQMVQEVLLPTLNAGTHVVCDRFLDSTIAYQGAGNGVDQAIISKIGLFATAGIRPDLTLLFDIDVAQGLSRTNAKKDRIEKRAIAYHERVRQGYLDIAKKDPKRVKVIAVDAPKEVIFQRVKEYIEEIL